MSSFLGNVYLLPLDLAFKTFRKRREVEYLRYMDDVTVMAKSLVVARDALFLMNQQLRDLRLTIQGSKTRIFRGSEIEDEFIDERFDEVNALISRFQDERRNPSVRKDTLRKLRPHLRKVSRSSHRKSQKDARLFRRLLSGLADLDDSSLVRPALDELDINPDAKYLASAMRYLTGRQRNRHVICTRLTRFLRNRVALFPYQDADVLRGIRSMPVIPTAAYAEARRRFQRRQEHWYVRGQAALLLAQRPLTRTELAVLRYRFDRETSIEVRRALSIGLAQAPKNVLTSFVRALMFSVEPRLQRVGRVYYGLLYSEPEQRAALSSMFHEFTDARVAERLYQLDVLAKTDNDNVRQTLADSLEAHSAKIKRGTLRLRLHGLRNQLPRPRKTKAKK